LYYKDTKYFLWLIVVVFSVRSLFFKIKAGKKGSKTREWGAFGSTLVGSQHGASLFLNVQIANHWLDYKDTKYFIWRIVVVYSLR